MKKQTRTRSGSAFCMGELARMAGEAAGTRTPAVRFYTLSAFAFSDAI